MSEKNWTPGPWRQSTGLSYCAIRNDDGVIADMRFVARHYNPYDAHLIAAAPDLVEALEGLARMHRETFGLDGAFDKEIMAAESALAKAYGETK